VADLGTEHKRVCVSGSRVVCLRLKDNLVVIIIIIFVVVVVVVVSSLLLLLSKCTDSSVTVAKRCRLLYTVKNANVKAAVWTTQLTKCTSYRPCTSRRVLVDVCGHLFISRV